MRTFADEIAAAKYAHVERERRWLVDREARPSLDGAPCELIEDRYIRSTRCRLRQMTDCASGERASKLTKKYDVADPLARPIVTAYLDDTEYSAFATLGADPLSKRRYSVESDGRTWSLDCFEGRLAGLELLEIEAASRQELDAIVPPAWAGAEVSSDAAYQGGNLARRGLPGER